MSAVVPDKETINLLRLSKDQVKSIYPALIDKETKKVLDGKHRKYADPAWPEKIVDCGNDDLKRELVTIHANIRRPVSEEEKKMRFNRVAQILVNRGVELGQIVAEMAKLLPYKERTIYKYVSKEFKLPTGPKTKMAEIARRAISEDDREEMGFDLTLEDKPKLTVKMVKKQQEEIRQKLKPVVEKFRQIKKDAENEAKAMQISGEMPSQYPFAECLCPKCTKKNLCPKVVV
ncbi:hypothetical protein JXA31_01765 [Candidatus Bathyarchaeota archaeon]|nr:hypothetical protein [Candidatus Bathyarchaeota archaeon]